MSAVTQPQVLEGSLRWSDNRRIFIGESSVSGRMLFRAEMEPFAVDDAVLQKWDELQAAAVAAEQAYLNRAALILHKAS